jgi:hypothetical protein
MASSRINHDFRRLNHDFNHDQSRQLIRINHGSYPD